MLVLHHIFCTLYRSIRDRDGYTSIRIRNLFRHTTFYFSRTVPLVGVSQDPPHLVHPLDEMP